MDGSIYLLVRMILQFFLFHIQFTCHVYQYTVTKWNLGIFKFSKFWEQEKVQDKISIYPTTFVFGCKIFFRFANDVMNIVCERDINNGCFLLKTAEKCVSSHICFIWNGDLQGYLFLSQADDKLKPCNPFFLVAGIYLYHSSRQSSKRQNVSV